MVRRCLLSMRVTEHIKQAGPVDFPNISATVLMTVLFSHCSVALHQALIATSMVTSLLNVTFRLLVMVCILKLI